MATHAGHVGFKLVEKSVRKFPQYSDIPTNFRDIVLAHMSMAEFLESESDWIITWYHITRLRALQFVKKRP